MLSQTKIPYHYPVLVPSKCGSEGGELDKLTFNILKEVIALRKQ